MCQTLLSVSAPSILKVQPMPQHNWQHLGACRKPRITFIEGCVSDVAWALFTGVARYARLIRQVSLLLKVFSFSCL